MGAVCIAVSGFVFFLIVEWVLLWCARKQFALVIHVNGTRGKSTVTRMIHAALRARGMEVFGKTTGSAARFLLPNGTEKRVMRFGPANVREQRNMMIAAAFWGKRACPEKGSRALVFECNAVQEELQRVSAQWIRPDITIITNVREDHVPELGSPAQAARVFAAAIPKNSMLITPERGFMEIWEAAAKQKKFRVWYVNPHEAAAGDFPENTACVRGLIDCLGIDQNRAPQSDADYKPDAGSFAIYSWKSGSHNFFFADARAANDVESTERLSAAALKIIQPGCGARRILLLINRADRPDRTLRFLRYAIDQCKERRFDLCLCLGHSPLLLRKTMKREGINFAIPKNVGGLDRILEAGQGHETYILGAGNYGGAGVWVTKWLGAKQREPNFSLLGRTKMLEAERQ
jgi:poly-gamma-glutamate synthase PgsB/CapB